MYGIARNVGGISLNGLEFVLNDDDSVMTFDNPEEVKRFAICELGAINKDFDEGVYQTIELKGKI